MSDKKSKKNSKVLMARNSIIGFITTIAILIFGFGSYVSLSLSEQDIDDSADYREVDSPKQRRASDPIEVVEFFSYTCIHCKTFDPIIEEWAAEQGDGVAFSRAPAMWSPIQTLLGRTYLTLADQDALANNHGRIFRAIHDGRRQFLTPEMMAEYVDGRGISAEDFLRTFNSPAMRRATSDVERDAIRFQVSGTPSMVVGGQYVVGMQGGQGHALRVVEHLIEKIRAADRGETPAEPETADAR
ncbi:MAG: thiol:disulfide interchange protein DsbA [Limisphaerales bacterium]|jgi:thiol:disulfide interchange protein DsbA